MVLGMICANMWWMVFTIHTGIFVPFAVISTIPVIFFIVSETINNWD